MYVLGGVSDLKYKILVSTTKFIILYRVSQIYFTNVMPFVQFIIFNTFIKLNTMIQQKYFISFLDFRI